MKKLALLLVLCSPVMAQISTPAVVPTTTTPTVCSSFLYALTTASPWTIYGPTTGNACQVLGSGGGSFTAGGDLSGSSTSQQVIGINSVAIGTNSGLLNFTTGTPSFLATGTSGATVPLNNGNNNFSGDLTQSVAGAASTSGLTVTGTPATGSTTTDFPYWYFSPSGATPPTFNAGGHYIGISMANGFAGHIMDVWSFAGGNRFSLTSTGNMTLFGTLTNTSTTITYAATLAIPIGGGTERLTLTTGGVTSSTIAAGSDGQHLCLDVIQSSTTAQTIVWPANLHGVFTIGATLGKDNVQCFTYSGTSTAWLAESAGITNE